MDALPSSLGRPPRPDERRRARAVFGVVATLVLVAASFGAPGCSSDTTAAAPPSSDASADRAAPPKTDAGEHHDGARPADGSATDSTTRKDGSSPVGDGGATDGIPADLVVFCSKYATTTCDLQIACKESGLEPRDLCIDGNDRQCLTAMRAAVPAIRAGRFAYDGSVLDTCLADSKATFCGSNNLGAGAPSCARVFHGLVPLGGTCYRPYFPISLGGFFLNECTADGYCSAKINSCPGTCTAFTKVGGACTMVDNHCAPGDYCDGAECRATLSLGASCAAPGVLCGAGLTCGPTDATDGGIVCETPKAQGARCTEDGECDRSYCLTGTCRPGHAGESCAAYLQCDPGLSCGSNGCQTPIAEGGACSSLYDACASGLVCEVKALTDAGDRVGSCEKPATPAAGNACFNGLCAAGAWCDTSTSTAGTCRVSGGLGAACSVGTADTCATGFACNGTTKECQVRSGVGGVCDPDWTSTCKDALACGPDKKCASKVAVGAPCSFRAQCPENYDCNGTCKLGKIPGAACVDGDLCIGGTCNTVAGTCNGDCIDPG